MLAAALLTASIAYAGIHVGTLSGMGLPYYVSLERPLPALGRNPFDSQGIRRHDYGAPIGWQYNPRRISRDAIGYHYAFHRVPAGYRPHPGYRQAFLNCVAWLEANLTDLPDGSAALLHRYPLEHRGGGASAGPWMSAATQARAIRVFTLAYRWSGDERHLDTAQRLLGPIFTPVADGGLLYEEGGLVFFEEYTNPAPDHALAAHMMVILDLDAFRDARANPKVDRWIQRGVESLKQVLPMYEMPGRMAYALRMRPDSRFSDPQPVENTYWSYDLIHLHYLNNLYYLTGDEFFRTYFWRYYAMTVLKEPFQNTSNIVAPGAIGAVSGTGFRDYDGHRLSDALGNHRLDPVVHASGLEVAEGESAWFSVELDRPRLPASLTLQFRWHNYPRTFKLEAMTPSGWTTLAAERGWEPPGPAPWYSTPIDEDEPITAIRFTARDFSDQQRLLLSYFSVREASAHGAPIAAWRSVSDHPALEYAGAEPVLDELADEYPTADWATVNARLLDALAERMAASLADLSRFFDRVACHTCLEADPDRFIVP